MKYKNVTMQEALDRTTHNIRVKESNERCKKNEWGAWVDGVPVFQQVKDLADKLRASCPDFKFAPADYEWHNVNGNSELVFCSLYVFLDDCPLNVGVIGYGDYRIRRQGGSKNQYMVFSRLIGNAKFGEYRDQHHMKMSDSLDKLVKECLRYLTPYTTQELAKAFVDPLKNNVQNRIQALGNEEWDLLRPIVNNTPVLIKELRRLMDEGVEFKDPAFLNFVSNIRDLERRMREEKAKNTKAKFVRLRTVGDTKFADLAEVVDIKESKYNEVKFGSPSTTIPAEDLPEDIVGKVAVLSILNDGQYAPDVGYKVNDNIFFVEMNNV